MCFATFQKNAAARFPCPPFKKSGPTQAQSERGRTLSELQRINKVLREACHLQHLGARKYRRRLTEPIRGTASSRGGQTLHLQNRHRCKVERDADSEEMGDPDYRSQSGMPLDQCQHVGASPWMSSRGVEKDG